MLWRKEQDEETLGKPLISDNAMLGMYTTLQRLRTPGPSPHLNQRRPSQTSRAGHELGVVLAAALWQLHRRDTLLVEKRHASSRRIAEAMQAAGELKSALHVLPGASEECAAFAAGMGLQQPRSGRAAATSRPVVVALLSEFSALKGVLQLVGENALPVLLVTLAAPETRTEAQRRLLSTTVPIMPVDAADTVALCRVLQECLLRARNGWGGAVIQALRLPDAQDPLLLMEGHLRKRGLQTPST